jgi:hypothetical protein
MSLWNLKISTSWKWDPKNCEGHGGGHKEASEDQNGNFSRGIEQKSYLILMLSRIRRMGLTLELSPPADGSTK